MDLSMAWPYSQIVRKIGPLSYLRETKTQSPCRSSSAPNRNIEGTNGRMKRSHVTSDVFLDAPRMYISNSTYSTRNESPAVKQDCRRCKKSDEPSTAQPEERPMRQVVVVKS